MAYFDTLTEQQELVWKDRFAERDKNFNVKEKTIQDTFRRVSKMVSKMETENYYWNDEFFNIMNNGLFIPGGRILSNIGTPNNNGFNCYVLDVEDDLSSIFESIKKMALIQQKGGGTGFSFSKLRPKGDLAKTSHSHSSGPCSFISAFNACSNVILSGSRRAANMAILSIYHPDIVEFIEYKRKHPGDWERFNVSVDVDQAFMDAVKSNQEVNLVFNGKVYKTISAKYLWNLLCGNAWAYGDPGIVDLTYANQDFDYPLICGKPVIATNPCFSGECKVLTNYGYQPFKDLEKYPNRFTNLKIYNGKTFESAKVFKSGNRETITLVTKNGNSIRCTPDHKLLTEKGWREAKDCFCYRLNNILGVYDESKIVSITESGTTDVYDFTMEAGEPQGVVESFIVHNCSEKIMHPGDQCCLGSINLVGMVDNKSSNTPVFNCERFKDTIRSAVRFLDNIYDVTTFVLPENREIGLNHRRIGLGIMGYADLCYLMGVKYSESDWVVKQLMSMMVKEGFKASIDLAKEKGKNILDPQKYIQSPFIKRNIPELIPEILENGIRNMNILSIAPTGTISMLTGVSSGIEPVFAHSYDRTDALTNEPRRYYHKAFEYCKSKDNFGELWKKGIYETAHDLSPVQHVYIHGQFAPYVDSNISKTTNLPNDATVEDVSNTFILAREYGIKSTTVYRDGSRNQVLNSNKHETCPECSHELQTDSNCKSCPSCGWSVCTI